MGYLESLIEQDNMATARRVRHLLGVCASYRGRYQQAIDMFLSVFDRPIREVADLKQAGYCEACYWLGDNYAMLNRRTEALLAYCAAERGILFNNTEEPHLSDLIRLEQAAVQLGVPKAEYKMRWAREAKAGSGSFLDPNVMSGSMARSLLGDESAARQRHSGISSTKLPYLDPNEPRAKGLSDLSTATQTVNFRRLAIRAEHFFPGAAWPMAYDPMFAMGNVKRERLLAQESDLLASMQSGTLESKIPKSGPALLGRIDCFTCGDLSWLITTLRACLTANGMDWSEIVNDQGVWFIARHAYRAPPSASPASKITTDHYFAISLFKQSFRSSYGAEICSHGVSSARILSQTELDHEKGVHNSEPKRIKKLIRDYLENAADTKTKGKKRESSIGLGIFRHNSDDQTPRSNPDGAKPPAVPPRPAKQRDQTPSAFIIGAGRV